MASPSGSLSSLTRCAAAMLVVLVQLTERPSVGDQPQATAGDSSFTFRGEGSSSGASALPSVGVPAGPAVNFTVLFEQYHRSFSAFLTARKAASRWKHPPPSHL